MKVVIEGLWHLGLVTAAGMLKLGNEVICYSNNKYEIDKLKKLELPLFEKGLLDIFKNYLKKKKIKFTSNIDEIKNAEIYWYCKDTSVNHKDQGDTDEITKNILERLDELINCKELIISSQIRIGTFEKIENKIKTKNKKINLYYIPENLRLGKAMKRFLKPDRIIVGLRNKQSPEIIIKLYKAISKKIIFVKPESAEMIKHSINTYLANSICFINEIARISNTVNADPLEVSTGLKSDERIGYKSYLSPGGSYGGGTLGRDVFILKNLSKIKKIQNPVISNITKSNNITKNYLKNFFTNNYDVRKKVLILGLAYTEGTSTLRRSDALALGLWLKKKKINFHLHDPIINKLSKNIYEKFTFNLDKKILYSDVIILMYKHNFYKKFQKVIFDLAKKKNIYLYDPFFIFERNYDIKYI